MTRAALYARYSSDNQREASIEDQFRLCREHAARERWQIVGSYEDAAISGASTSCSGVMRSQPSRIGSGARAAARRDR